MKELNFPMNFKCPKCGSADRILNYLAEKERAEGLLPQDTTVGTRMEQTFLAEDGLLRSGKLCGKKIRVVQKFYDLCVKCGVEYIYLVRAEEIEIPMPPKESKLLVPKKTYPPPGAKAKNSRWGNRN